MGKIPTERFVQVTPDGRHLAFQSEASLTGYDNVSANGGKPAIEVYLYDADAEQLDCISCNPSGGRPLSGFLPIPHTNDHSNRLAAAWLPTPSRETYFPRVLAGDGKRLFFHGFDALVPEDTNGAQDVYEWEAQGTGSCQKESGCTDLISTGKSPKDSEFIDASADGRDVFIRTNASIDPRDPGLIDIYDVRAGGGFPPPPPPPPPCIGDACQGVPALPDEPTPASASFRGAGNPVPRKPRRSCRARSRHGKQAKSQAKSKQTKRCKRTNRRAGR
jgi:hypothetical protein